MYRSFARSPGWCRYLGRFAEVARVAGSDSAPSLRNAMWPSTLPVQAVTSLVMLRNN